MKKNHFSIALIVFFSCFLFACGKAPNTVKVLRGLNNAVANYWLDLVQKNGVNYVDYDGANIIAIALEAKNAELLQATIKDGADLHRKYKNSNGVEKYPLEFVILDTDRYFNQFVSWELAKILVDAGTRLQYDTGSIDILLAAWRHGNAELIDLLLPGFKKQKLLDYSNFENTEAMRIVISDALYLGFIPDDEVNRDENMIARFKKLAEAGVKLPQAVVEDFLKSFRGPPKNPAAVEYLLKMADMNVSDLDVILSRKKVIYVPVVESLAFYKKPTGDYYDMIGTIQGGGFILDGYGDYRRSERFELLELGKIFTDGGGKTSTWLYVKRESNGMNGWILSHDAWEEEKLQFMTTANVHLRSDPHILGDSYYTLPEGSMVKLFYIDRIDTIDGITSPWYRVSYLIPEKDIAIGYIFSGYLRQMEK